MADYSIAVKIAGELASSFQSSIKGAQSGLAGLAGAAGKLGGLAMKGAAAGIGAASTAAIGLGTTAVNVGKEFESAMSQGSAGQARLFQQQKPQKDLIILRLLDTMQKKRLRHFQLC